MDRKRTHSVLLVLVTGCLLSLGCSSQKNLTDSRVFRMGERVEVGSLIYTVMDTEWHDQLGEGPSARLPQNRFLLIRLSVTNSGVSDSAVPAMSLVDARGQSFTELTDGQGVTEWMGFLRTVKPAQTERGRVLFDVPTGAYRLRVANDAEPEIQKAAHIEIPLQLMPAVPDLPAR